MPFRSTSESTEKSRLPGSRRRGLRPDTRADDARQSLLVEPCEAVELELRESTEEELAHRRVVDDLCAS
jgi:hypothetical protein